MLKPKLVKSLITQNANLIRQRQQFIDYLRSLELVLRAMEKEGRMGGVVQLDNLTQIRSQIKDILASSEMRMFRETGSLNPPTKRNLGEVVEADKQIESEIISLGAIPISREEEEKVKDFIEKFIKDIVNYHENKKENANPSDPMIDPMNFGGDLEGEWQDFPPDDPFSSDDKQ
jgi:hypothetical protein